MAETDQERLARLRRLRELREKSSVPYEEYTVTAAPTPVTLADLQAMGYESVPEGPWQAFKESFARGVRTVGRGLNLPGAGYQEPDVYQQFRAQRTREEFPKSSLAGEVVGEATPFMVASSPIGAVPSTLARIGLSGTLGAAEGAAISRGNGGDAEQTAESALIGGVIAGGAEALFPYISRAGRSLFRRLRGTDPSGALLTRAGRPTPEFQSALDDIGLSFDDFTKTTIDDITSLPAGADPQQAARLSRFNQLDLPSTRGDITQDFAQQVQEERLIGMSAPEAGEPLRNLRLAQSERFQAGINSLVDNLGIPQEAGEKVKLALQGRLDDLTAQKNTLYRSMAETSPHVTSMPMFTDTLRQAMPSATELRRAARLDGNDMNAFRELLVEFGIEQSDEAVEAFTKAGGEVMPLNLGNFEEFRQALNALGNGTTSGGRRTRQLVKPFIKTLDDELDRVDSALQAANITDRSIVDNVKQARQIVRQIKTDFSPQSVIGRLVGTKADEFTPIVEASKVFDSVVTNKPTEYLDRVVTGLLDSGQPGQQALGDMQATAILRAMDKALAAPSRKSSGMQLFNYGQFYKELEKLGDDKLSLLFKNNPQALNTLKMFQETARDLTPNALAMPKGSAHTILDMFSRMSTLPGLSQVKDVARWAFTSGADERAVRHAMKNSPRISQTVGMLEREFPSLASSLGIVGWLSMAEDKEQTGR